MPVILNLHGTDLPGITCHTAGGPYTFVHVGVQVGRDVVERQRADAASVHWQLSLDMINDGADVRGKNVHGKRGDRFLYLCWGHVDDAGAFHMFRRAKLMLAAIDDDVLRGALRTGSLEATLPLTLPDGTPVCAAVRPPRITWRA